MSLNSFYLCLIQLKKVTLIKTVWLLLLSDYFRYGNSRYGIKYKLVLASCYFRLGQPYRKSNNIKFKDAGIKDAVHFKMQMHFWAPRKALYYNASRRCQRCRFFLIYIIYICRHLEVCSEIYYWPCTLKIRRQK